MVGVASPGSGLSIGPGLVAELCMGSPDYVNLRSREIGGFISCAFGTYAACMHGKLTMQARGHAYACL